MNCRAEASPHRRSPSPTRSAAVALAAIVLICLGPAALAGSAESADQGPRYVYTNLDLPTIYGPPETECNSAATSQEATSTLEPAEFIGAAPFAFHERMPVTRMTVPELLDELDHLQRRRMRLAIPFISRRFAQADAFEREAEAGLGPWARSTLVQTRLDEVKDLLNEADVAIPSRGFGQPAPLIVGTLGESPRPITTLTSGVAVRQQFVARADDDAQFRARVFRRLEEHTDLVTREEFRDSRPEAYFSAFSDEMMITRIW